jgi:cell division protein FtsL
MKAMKRWKKIVLLLLGLIVISQLPFIYRRYRMGQLADAIRRLNSERVLPQGEQAYADYRGVIHVHSSLGGHSTGSLEEIISAARLNELNFVVMTEHPAKELSTTEMTLKGMHGGALFVAGSEVGTTSGDRLLIVPGTGEQTAGAPVTQPLIDVETSRGSLTFIAYPQEFHTWDATGYTGIEVYNLYTNTRKVNYFLLFFDGLWSYRAYPELMFTTFYERPTEALAKWDEQLAKQNFRPVAVAGNDAHSNVGLSLGDATGKKLFEIKLDPYERSFRLVRNHVLIEREKPLNEESLLAALRDGHSYISFDLLCDATGFTYTAENRAMKRIAGDEIGLEDGVRLRVGTPVKSRIVLIKDGQRIAEEKETTGKEFSVSERGAYRVEVYLDQLGASFYDRPWIISNPVYVR